MTLNRFRPLTVDVLENVAIDAVSLRPGSTFKYLVPRQLGGLSIGVASRQIAGVLSGFSSANSPASIGRPMHRLCDRLSPHQTTRWTSRLLTYRLPVLVMNTSTTFFQSRFVVIKWRYLYILDSIISVRMVTHDWLQPIWIYTAYLPNYTNFHVLRIIFRDRQVRWRMMLLVGHQDVGH